MDTMMRIETNLNKSILAVANSLQSADMTAQQMIGFLTPVLRSSGEDVKDADVKKMIWEAGMADALRVIAEVIAFILGANEGNVTEAASE